MLQAQAEKDRQILEKQKLKANKAEAEDLQIIPNVEKQDTDRGNCGEKQNFISPKAGSNKVNLDNSQSSEKSALGLIKQDTASSK